MVQWLSACLGFNAFSSKPSTKSITLDLTHKTTVFPFLGLVYFIQLVSLEFTNDRVFFIRLSNTLLHVVPLVNL